MYWFLLGPSSAVAEGTAKITPDTLSCLLRALAFLCLYQERAVAGATDMRTDHNSSFKTANWPSIKNTPGSLKLPGVKSSCSSLPIGRRMVLSLTPTSRPNFLMEAIEILVLMMLPYISTMKKSIAFDNIMK